MLWISARLFLYRACQQLGVEPFIRYWRGTQEETVSFVVSENLMRRHLNESHRGMAAAKLANISHGGDMSEVSIDTSLQDAAESMTLAEQLPLAPASSNAKPSNSTRIRRYARS
jgi:hypothetical protein